MGYSYMGRVAGSVRTREVGAGYALHMWGEDGWLCADSHGLTCTCNMCTCTVVHVDMNMDMCMYVYMTVDMYR